MEETEEEYFGPARNIGELILACIELASQVEAIDAEKEKVALLKEHIITYTQNEIPMVDFEAGLEWFNVSRALTLVGDLKGRISVLDFFTYCCINCMHILPDLECLEDKHPPENGEVLVVGVHSAKFENERVSANIEAAIQKYDIHHPVVNDSQAKLWKHLGISCWPTLLILGPNGQPLFVLVGEGHRQRLQFYVSTAIQYFAAQKLLTRQPLPLALSVHLEVSDTLLLYPGKIATYPGGLIIADSGHNRILLVNKEGTVKKVVGSGKRGFRNGSLMSSSFSSPQGVVYHHPDTIYIADTNNHAIRKVDLILDEVTTLIGTGEQGFDLEGGQEEPKQVISSPWDLCMARSLDLPADAPENLLLIAMAGTHQIWGVFLTGGKWLKGSSYNKGIAVRLAGSGAEENRNTTYPARAGFAQPSGIALGYCSGQPVLYIADAESSSIRRFSISDGAVKGVVGAARDPMDLFAYGDVDGSGIEAKLQHPLGVTALDETVYVADSYNHKIKVIKPVGKSYMLTTVAGTGMPGNVAGSAKKAQFNEPGGLCIDKEESLLYIADTNNHNIKVLSLEQEEVRVLEIKMEDDTDYTNQEVQLPVSEVEETTVILAGEVVEAFIKLQLDLPPGAYMNQEAPNIWKIENSDSCILIEPMRGKLQETTELLATINMPSSGCDQAVLCFNVILYMCLDSGVCTMRQVKHVIKFIVVDSANRVAAENVSVDVILKL